jgi:transposase
MKTTKSPLTIARLALELAERCYPSYSCPKSPRRFTQPQLVACLVVKEFLRLDYRGVQQTLLEWSDLRKVLGLTKVPHFTSLCSAHKRLLRKRHMDLLLSSLLQRCRNEKLLSETVALAAIDSTGLESRHVSHYFTRRSERHAAHYKATYPKLSAVCDTRTHLILGVTVDRGPTVDHCEFRPTVQRALAHQPFKTLLADAGYDSEKAHHWCRDELGIRSIIPPRTYGRRRLDGAPRGTYGHYRVKLLRRFPRKLYGQRWQIETAFSVIKRCLGAALRARTYHSQCREVVLKVLTYNLMILLLGVRMFYTEQTCPYFCPYFNTR